MQKLPTSPSASDNFRQLYPERRQAATESSMREKISGWGHKAGLKNCCQSDVVNCLENFSLLKLMLNAVESKGCRFDISRNISCEWCEYGSNVQHFGGYDESTNQVFLCANNLNKSYTCGALLRGLIQMFDECSRKVDHTNAGHLACTEIRKANLANCNFLQYMSQPFASVALKSEHSECVRKTAVISLAKTKFLDLDQAEKAVDSVFDKCYADLEPIGRRSVSADDMKRAYYERYLFNY